MIRWRENPYVDDAQVSAVFPSYNDNGKPTPELIDLAVDIIHITRYVDISSVSDRITIGPKYPDMWPGEHYKLLAGIVKYLQPKTVIEIGTHTGHSLLSLKKYLPNDGKLISFDVAAWKTVYGTILTDEDFIDGSIVQYTDDISMPGGFSKYRELIESADLIFVDAAKDGQQENRFMDQFAQCTFKNAPLLVFDDIRLQNMLVIWRSINLPKLDLTSFGHWAGTGLVQWPK